MTRVLVLLAFALPLCGCIGYDFKDVEKEPSYMLPLTETGDTEVGRRLSALVEEHPGKSAFYIQTDGVESLATRIVAAGHASHSIDAQYYLFSDDNTTLAFMGALLNAADRGVRVRLLLDDALTMGYDNFMIAVDGHPNIEIRMYNPFLRRQARWMDGLLGFKRVNRRMHNKSFTVDNRFTIVGGRNIGAEYFAGREDMNFADTDILAVGPVVRDVSNMFDTYWNNDLAVPLSEVAKPPKDPEAALEEVRAYIQEGVLAIRDSQYGEALTTRVEDLYDPSDEGVFLSEWELVYDAPEKGRTDKLAQEAEKITFKLAESINSAEESVLIISPYFVPGRSALKAIQEYIDRGLRIIVVTNSLAATNHHIVHSGYAPTRKKMLKMGVEIWETVPDRALAGTEDAGTADAVSGLHTKGFIVDQEEFFFGSFNMDPRSANINTELGVIIKSPEMSTRIYDILMERLPEVAYQVILTEQNDLAWLDQRGEKPVIFTKEPQTSWGTRTKVNMMRILPIKGQL